MFRTALSSSVWRLVVWLLRVATAAIALGAVVYWWWFAPLKVASHVVEQGPIVAEILGTGTLEAKLKVSISPKISGRLEQVLADQDERVETNQKLVVLDDDELRQQVAIAEANRQAALAAVERLSSDKKRAEAIFDQSQKSHARIAELFAKNAQSRDDLDRAIEALAVAQAEVARADAAISEGQKLVAAAEETLSFHRARLADTTIAAPFAGLVVRRHRDPGDVVVPGSSILSLVSTDLLWISAWVDETAISQVHTGQPARVVFRSDPEKSYPGTVLRLGKETDRETREFIVDVQVLELPGNWAVGQRGEVYIEYDRRTSTVVVPARFLARQDDQPGCFVLREGRAQWRPLTVGLRGADRVEITDGLNAGETVLLPTDASHHLIDGQRVRP